MQGEEPSFSLRFNFSEKQQRQRQKGGIVEFVSNQNPCHVKNFPFSEREDKEDLWP